MISLIIWEFQGPKGFYTSNSVRWWLRRGNYGPGSNNQRLSHPPINQKVFWKSLVLTLQKLLDVVIFDPVIGRDDEIRRVIEILNRRTKNNPVLIGEPGVGKTAVVEGLAQK